MVSLPASDHTFLFTDIEGSTQLWERDPEAMQTALARHDAILRQAIETNHGSVFKTMGDEFCAVFPLAPDALSAALDAQRALYAEPWGKTPIKIRMALHTGPAEERDGDYFGPTLNRVARLLFAGHGGQTLLSAATEKALQGTLPQEIALRNMGEWQLKDLIRPERIYQLLAPGLPSEFAPLKSLEAFRTNLPAQLTSFIGREKEIAAVKELIATNRLVTLVGSGGAGKTRLSLQVAADLLDSFPDGVWFVELAPLSDPALVPQTVAAALGLNTGTNRPILDLLADYLRPKTALLILDNCEHLVAAAAQFSETLLQVCPDLRILASSRETLEIPGEISYRVPSLSFPDNHFAETIETIIQSEAVRLFVERARVVQPTFTLTPENAGDVAKICARLDGIPLAIELAAARAKMLTVEQIAERLNNRFLLLTNGSRTALPRHQTLQALIDWSYDLLSEKERILLRRLSIFAGGWTLEDAEAVCANPEEVARLDLVEVLDTLTQLVNKSLVIMDSDDSDKNMETRYHLSETVRQYAREKLSDANEVLSAHNHHLDYFLDLAERAEAELMGPQVVHCLRRLDAELDNIRAALEWSLNHDARLGLRLANALMWFWAEAGYFRDGRNWLAQLLNQPETLSQTTLRAKSLGRQGYLLGDSDQAAGPILEESLALCQKLDDKKGAAFSLLHLGIVIFRNGDIAEGRRLVAESLALYRELGDKLGTVMALHHLASNVDNNDYQRARAYLDEALTICRETEYLIGASYILSDLGHQALRQGNYRAARLWLEETLAKHQQLGKGSSIVYTLIHLGELASREGNYIQAHACYEESLSLARQTGVDAAAIDWTFAKLGYTVLWQGDAVRARELFEKSLTRFTETANTIGIIYTLDGFASLAIRREQPAQAARLYGWTETMRKTMDSQRPPVEQADVDRDLTKIRAQLDEATFATAQAKGQVMSVDEAIAYALESAHD